jgi:enoyl-CoA hydratase
MSQYLSLSFLDWPFALLTFDQVGSKVNVLSTAMWNELDQALEEAGSRAGIEGLILRSGKPGVFVAGADLKEFEHASPDNPGPTRAFLELGHHVLDRLENLPFPTAAVIDGACLGGGFEVALACDYRFVGTHPKVRVGFPEVGLGLIPGWGGTQRLSRLLGPMAAFSHVCSGQTFGAEQALTEGLAFDVVPSEELVSRAKELLAASREDDSWREVRRVKRGPAVEAGHPSLDPDGDQFLRGAMESYLQQLQGPPRAAAREALDVIFRGAALPLDSALRIETEAFLRLAGSAESKTMIEEFFAKRK